MATKLIFKQFFKASVPWNRWLDFEIISEQFFFGDPLKKMREILTLQ